MNIQAKEAALKRINQINEEFHKELLDYCNNDNFDKHGFVIIKIHFDMLKKYIEKYNLDYDILINLKNEVYELMMKNNKFILSEHIAEYNINSRITKQPDKPRNDEMVIILWVYGVLLSLGIIILILGIIYKN